jgi:hypothetical protein
MNRNNSPPRMKVVIHRPARSLLIGTTAVVVALLMALLGYWLGRGQTSLAFSANDDLEARYNAKAREAVDLERKLADVQLSQVVDPDASESLRQTIKSLRDELSASKEEVLFYRQLMAPSEAQRGLRIEKLELTGGNNPAEVNYRLLLTQVAERNDWATGSVTVDIVGSLENEQVVLPLTEMTHVESYPLGFRFRYFQDFTGSLVVPPGLKPAQVVVTAVSSGKDAKRVQKTFEWALEEY